MTVDARTGISGARFADRAVSWLERGRNGWAVLGVASAAYVAIAMWLTRGTTLFIDETALFSANRGLHLETLFTPLNGHLVFLSRTVYALGFDLFGANFVVFRAVEVAGAALAASLLFALAKRRMGAAGALPLAVLLLFLGSAWEVSLTLSGYTNVYSLSFGLAALLVLDREDGRGDAWACGFLVASILSWSLGVAFAAGVGVVLLVRGAARRLWVVLLPLVLYAAWFIAVHAGAIPAQNGSNALHGLNALLIPSFIARVASTTAGAIAGVNYDFVGGHDLFSLSTSTSIFGPGLAALGVVALALRVRRGRVPWSLWTALAILLVFWTALALGFGVGRGPATVRYAYPSAALVFVVVAESLRGVSIPRPAILALIAGCALALGANLDLLRLGGDDFRSFSTGLRAQLTAIEIARGHVRSDFVPPTGPAGVELIIVAGPYLSAVERNGSPAFTTAELASQSEGVRTLADETLASALRIGLRPAPPGAAARSCRPVGGPDHPAIAVRPGTRLVLRSPVPAGVGLRRFASATADPVGDLRPGTASELILPSDHYPAPWQLSVSSARPARVCDAA